MKLTILSILSIYHQLDVFIIKKENIIKFTFLYSQLKSSIHKLANEGNLSFASNKGTNSLISIPSNLL